MDDSDAQAPVRIEDDDGLRGRLDAALKEVDRLKARLAAAQRLAGRDPLTGAPNRRAFLHELRRACAFSTRYGASASLAFFDLDGFKAVNDVYGHAAGDEVLRAVAKRLSARVRESDMAARLGGDEFAVLLRQTAGPAARAKAASLVDAIEAAPVAFRSQPIQVAASVGMRDWEAGLKPARWLAEADASMFVNKGVRRGG